MATVDRPTSHSLSSPPPTGDAVPTDWLGMMIWLSGFLLLGLLALHNLILGLFR